MGSQSRSERSRSEFGGDIELENTAAVWGGTPDVGSGDGGGFVGHGGGDEVKYPYTGGLNTGGGGVGGDDEDDDEGWPSAGERDGEA